VTATATAFSPDAMAGSHRRFWSSVPPRSKARTRISGRVIKLPPAASEARDSSSAVISMAW
jgi:hypothetical protein